jgi:hypothetical protein
MSKMFRARSLSAVSEAPPSEERGVETLSRGRFRYSDLTYRKIKTQFRMNFDESGLVPRLSEPLGSLPRRSYHHEVFLVGIRRVWASSQRRDKGDRSNDSNHKRIRLAAFLGGISGDRSFASNPMHLSPTTVYERIEPEVSQK